MQIVKHFRRVFGHFRFFKKCSRIPKWLKTSHGVKTDLLFHFVLKWWPEKVDNFLFSDPCLFIDIFWGQIRKTYFWFYGVLFGSYGSMKTRNCLGKIFKWKISVWYENVFLGEVPVGTGSKIAFLGRSACLYKAFLVPSQN